MNFVQTQVSLDEIYCGWMKRIAEKGHRNLIKMKKVGIVACSDAQKEEYRKQNEELVVFLESIGITPVISSCIYEKDEGQFSGSPKEKAGELMRMFADPDIDEIYDISGGDVANQILDDLDYEKIGKSKAVLWGYSDSANDLPFGMHPHEY